MKLFRYLDKLKCNQIAPLKCMSCHKYSEIDTREDKVKNKEKIHCLDLGNLKFYFRPCFLPPFHSICLSLG